MWIVVFIVLALVGLAVLGLLSWRLIRQGAALLGELSKVLDDLSTLASLPHPAATGSEAHHPPGAGERIAG